MTQLEESARSSLREIGVEAQEVHSLEEMISTPTLALLLYGSRARGDFLAHSDFDLLRLAAADFRTFKSGRLSVSTYTTAQLSSASETLFGTHLLRDGRILYDPGGKLAATLMQIKPAQPAALLERVHRYSLILDLPLSEKLEHLSGLVRLARYLLRTAVYANAMQQGEPCFSVRELAVRFADPALATLLASDPAIVSPPSAALLHELTSRLDVIVGPFPVNRFGSLAATATGFWEADRNLAALAVRAGSEDDDASESLDYGDLPKVLL